ncbi:MAG: hypothetical protein RJQ07_09360 [Pseudomonadales bacterium]
MSPFTFHFDAHAQPSSAVNTHVQVPMQAARPLPGSAVPEEGLYCEAGVEEVWPLLPGESMRVYLSDPIHGQEQIAAASQALYQRILDEVPVASIYRIWNFLPDINGGTVGLDHYMRFCQGRADAYTQAGHATDLFAAASALGYRTRAGRLQGEQIIAVVLSGGESVVPVENPNQIPAYQYPQTYGPRSPSFARAATIGDSRVLVSGTASILKSESQHVGDPVAQTRLAADNVRTLLSLVAAEKLGHVHQHLRVYLRDFGHWPQVQGVLAQSFSFEQVQLVVAQADICRPELLIELEYASHR